MALSDSSSVPETVLLDDINCESSFLSLHCYSSAAFCRNLLTCLFLFWYQLFPLFSLYALQPFAQRLLLSYFALLQRTLVFVLFVLLGVRADFHSLYLSLQITQSPWKLVGRLLPTFTAVCGKLSCYTLRSVCASEYMNVWKWWVDGELVRKQETERE